MPCSALMLPPWAITSDSTRSSTASSARVDAGDVDVDVAVGDVPEAARSPRRGAGPGPTPGTASTNAASAPAGSVTSSLCGDPERAHRLGVAFAVAPQVGTPCGVDRDGGVVDRTDRDQSVLQGRRRIVEPGRLDDEVRGMRGCERQRDAEVRAHQGHARRGAQLDGLEPSTTRRSDWPAATAEAIEA